MAANREADDVPQLVDFKRYKRMQILCDGMDVYPDSYVLAVVESMTESLRRAFCERCFQRFGSRYYVATRSLETASCVESWRNGITCPTWCTFPLRNEYASVPFPE